MRPAVGIPGVLAATLLLGAVVGAAQRGETRALSGLSAVGSLILALAVSAASAALVHWVVPAVLGGLVGPLQGSLAAAAGLVLLPEFLLTTALRRTGRAPLRLAYDLGDVIVWVVSAWRTMVRRLLDGLSRGARAAPPVAVGGVSGVLTLVYVLTQ
jgi:hypothetical protein